MILCDTALTAGAEFDIIESTKRFLDFLCFGKEQSMEQSVVNENNIYCAALYYRFSKDDEQAIVWAHCPLISGGYAGYMSYQNGATFNSSLCLFQTRIDKNTETASIDFSSGCGLTEGNCFVHP